jgi:hypothetical protein
MRPGMDERSQRAVSRTNEEPRFRGSFQKIVAFAPDSESLSVESVTFLFTYSSFAESRLIQ